MSDSSDPVDCNPPGSSVHGILQAKVLEWGAITFSDSLTTSYIFLQKNLETLAENRTLEICFKTQFYCFVVVVVLISDNNMESCRGYCYCFGVCTFKFLNYLNVVFLPSVSECECVCVCVCVVPILVLPMVPN